MNMSRWLRVCLAAAVAGAGSAPALAAPLKFDFRDPKGVNTLYFLLDSLLEPMMGLATGISGEVQYDPADAKATAGKITVDAKTLRMGNDAMTKKLAEPEWLDVEKHRALEFAFKKVTEVKEAAAGTRELTVVGDFTCRGVTKEMTVQVKASYLEGKLGERVPRQKGDLLILRSTFTINRKDFGIKPDMGGDIVAEDIEVRVSIVGVCPR